MAPIVNVADAWLAGMTMVLGMASWVESLLPSLMVSGWSVTGLRVTVPIAALAPAASENIAGSMVSVRVGMSLSFRVADAVPLSNPAAEAVRMTVSGLSMIVSS